MEDNNEIRESKIEEGTTESVEKEGGEEDKKGIELRIKVCAVVTAALLLFAILYVPTHTCTKCRELFFGKGYYSSDALWNPKAADITLCKSCASESWAPFDYRDHVKG